MKAWFLQSRFWSALLLLALAMLPPVLLRLPYGDEAHLFLKSLWMAEGRWIYRDFFEFVFPLAHTLYAGVIKLTGPSVIATRLLTLGFLLSALLATDQIARKYLSSVFRALLLGFLLTHQVILYLYLSHHAISAAFAVWAVYCLWRGIESQDSRWPALAGLLSGLALLSTQSLGMLLGLTLGGLTALLSFWRKKTASFTALYWAGYTLPVAAFAGFLTLSGLWPDFMDSTIGWLAQGQYGKTTVFSYFATGAADILDALFGPAGMSGPIRWEHLPLTLILLIIGWLPVLGLLWGVQMLWQNYRSLFAEDSRYRQLLLLVMASAAMVCATLSYSTTYHIAINGWIAYLLGVMALQSVTGRLHSPVRQVILLAFALVVLGNVWVETVQHYLTLRDERQWIHSYGTVERDFYSAMPHGQLLEYAVATEILRKLPEGEPVFVYNSSPELYILSDHPATGKFPLAYAVLLTSAQRACLLASLKAAPPRLVLFDHKEQYLHLDERFHRYTRAELRLSEVSAFLESRYASTRLGERFELYHLKQFPSP